MSVVGNFVAMSYAGSPSSELSPLRHVFSGGGSPSSSGKNGEESARFIHLRTLAAGAAPAFQQILAHAPNDLFGGTPHLRLDKAAPAWFSDSFPGISIPIEGQVPLFGKFGEKLNIHIRRFTGTVDLTNENFEITSRDGSPYQDPDRDSVTVKGHRELTNRSPLFG